MRDSIFSWGIVYCGISISLSIVKTSFILFFSFFIEDSRPIISVLGGNVSGSFFHPPHFVFIFFLVKPIKNEFVCIFIFFLLYKIR